MKTLMLLLTLSAGCLQLPISAPQPNQADAVQVVWEGTYGADHTAPSIEWLSGEQLNCLSGSDGKPIGFYQTDSLGSSKHTDVCLAGVTWEDMAFIQLALRSDIPFTYQTTSIAHELFHQYLYDTTGDGDNEHKNPGFGPAYGHPFGIVVQANEDLKAAGL